MKKVFLVTAAMFFVALSLPCGVKADSTGVKEGVAEAITPSLHHSIIPDTSG